MSSGKQGNSKAPSARPKSVIVPISMSEALAERVEEAARRVNLSKQDTMRLSLDRGLDVLVEQLTGKTEAVNA